MTAQVAVTPVSSGAVITETSGAAPGTDTVPGGVVLLVRNTGAGTHVITIGIAATLDGLQPGTTSGAGTRTISLTTAQVAIVRIPANYGDANGRVPFGVDGT